GVGSSAMEIALALRDFASTVGGREQIAIEAFADAVEVIPRTLAENAGLDPIDILIELRQQHKKGTKTAGINVFSGKVSDMKKENVIEPIRVGSLGAHRSLPAVGATSPAALGPPSPVADESHLTREPVSEVVVDPSSIYVTLELRGASSETLEVTTTQHRLTVHALDAEGRVF